MPYIIKDDRDLVVKNLNNIRTAGDLNYLITLVLLGAWKQVPRYETIHELRKRYVTEPKNNKFLTELRTKFADRFTVADIYTAAAEAFWEFRYRVGSVYEATKCVENGDLKEYEEAIVPLMERLAELKTKADASKLILPGQVKVPNEK